MRKLIAIMDSYRDYEKSQREMIKNNKQLGDRVREAEDRIPLLEAKIGELNVLVETLRSDSPQNKKV